MRVARWGESIVAAAQRELAEETGLQADFVHHGISHERVKHASTGEIVEDKIFFLMFTNNAHGSLQERFDGGRNVWRSLDSMAQEPKVYKGFISEMNLGITGTGDSTAEVAYEYSDSEF
jgi:ADP-ribose pyrophosphatase YjhB (NUDIX family)